jgi:hypothetical protein
MLLLLTGNKKDRKEAVNRLIEEHGGDPSRAQRIVFDDIGPEQNISDLVVTQSGLFGDTEFFVLTDMSRELDLKSLLEDYASSNNLIIFSEATVTKKILGEFQKVGVEAQEFAPEAKEAKPAFNVFSLADALGRRDKKNLWILYQQALRSASVEEINGILLWQLKNMALVLSSPSATKSMKPFVYKKNQGFAKNYSAEEVNSLIRSFTHAFHNRDIYDSLDIQVEKILLGL